MNLICNACSKKFTGGDDYAGNDCPSCGKGVLIEDIGTQPRSRVDRIVHRGDAGKFARDAARLFLILVPATFVIYFIAAVANMGDTSKDDPTTPFLPWAQVIAGFIMLSFMCGVIGLLQRIAAALEK